MEEREQLHTVRVEYVGPLAAKVWRAPDTAFPDGVAYALSLSRITTDTGALQAVHPGDVLSAVIDTTRNEIERAHMLSPWGSGALSRPSAAPQ